MSCGVGFYNPNVGSSSSSACKPCAAGYYCGTKGMQLVKNEMNN